MRIKKRASKTRICAIDVGNTTISLALCASGTVKRRCSCATPSGAMSRKDRKVLAGAVNEWKPDVAVICSVVPRLDRRLKALVRNECGVSGVFLIGKDIEVPIRNRYRAPAEVGQDRLVNAYAGYARYKKPLIIIDFGTAVTFDVVSAGGEYRGGVIVPGIPLSLYVLSHKAALLPEIEITVPRRVLGTTTRESMTSGIYHGYSALCEGVIKRLAKETRTRYKVIATGGNASYIAARHSFIHEVVRDLTAEGICLTYAASRD